MQGDVRHIVAKGSEYCFQFVKAGLILRPSDDGPHRLLGKLEGDIGVQHIRFGVDFQALHIPTLRQPGDRGGEIVDKALFALTFVVEGLVAAADGILRLDGRPLPCSSGRMPYKSSCSPKQ